VNVFLVEHYWPGVTGESFARAVQQVRQAADALAAAAEPIRFMHSTLVLEDENAFCVFEAASAGVVAEAYATAGVAFERIVEAVELEAGSVDKRMGGSNR
jgi:hypothetical protein